MNKKYWVYILTNKNITLFYTGITNDPVRRVYEHKNKLIEGYTSKYNLNVLVYYEQFGNPLAAIAREKQVKKYSQKKKLDLIQKVNPGLYDLYEQTINM